MTTGTTFNAWVWVAALKGSPPDPIVLRRLRLEPPRLRTRAVIDAEAAGVTWDATPDIPVELVAVKSAVRPATVVRRCQLWGIPIHARTVQLDGWPRRQKVLTETDYRVYLARALRPIPVSAGSRPLTSRAS